MFLQNAKQDKICNCQDTTLLYIFCTYPKKNVISRKLYENLNHYVVGQLYEIVFWKA